MNIANDNSSHNKKQIIMKLIKSLPDVNDKTARLKMYLEIEDMYYKKVKRAIVIEEGLMDVDEFEDAYDNVELPDNQNCVGLCEVISQYGLGWCEASCNETAMEMLQFYKTYFPEIANRMGQNIVSRNYLFECEMDRHNALNSVIFMMKREIKEANKLLKQHQDEINE